MPVLFYLLHPGSQWVETGLVINGKAQKYTRDAFVERPHNGPESLLPSLILAISYRIPDLEFSRGSFIDLHNLRSKLNPNSNIILFRELTLYIPH